MKKKIWLICLLSLLCELNAVLSYAQTAAERRRAAAKVLEDSMRAQTQRQNAAAALRRQRREAANNKAVFGDDDSIFRNNAFPDKWTDQSAVILACKTTYSYYTRMSLCCFDQIERRRIKILDKSAVDDLSEFYFFPTDDVGFTVIKKDGTVNKINLNDAVPVDEYLPVLSSYSLLGSESYLLNNSYKKIAIPGLEPGDIIDYYYKFFSTTFKNQITATPFPPLIFTLNDEYPIVSQKILFNVEKGFYINVASYNGAPDLKLAKDTASSNYVRNDTARKTVSYFVYTTNLDKRRNELWEDKYRSEPTIKFQVVYCPDKEKDNVAYFLGNTSQPLTVVPYRLLKAVANQIALTTTNEEEGYASAITKFMSRYNYNIKDPVTYMKYAYTYFRYFLIIGQVDDDNESGFSDDVDINLESKDEIRSDVFAKVMCLVCRDKKIPFDLIFTIPRNYGTVNNLIYPNEIRWAVKIKGTPDLYLYAFDAYRAPGETKEAMEGLNAYTITPNDDSGKIVMNKIITPNTSNSDNTDNLVTEVNLNPDMQGGAGIERTANITGLAKDRYYPDVIAEDQFLDREFKRYKGVTDEEYIKKIHDPKKKKEGQRRLEAYRTEAQKSRLEAMKAFYKDSYDIESYDTFQLLCDGREIDSTALAFHDKFSVKDALHKVGSNYIVDIGKFMEKKHKLDEKEKKRTTDVYLPYAGAFTNEVDITIPSGYTVDGIGALNCNVTNQAGGFISSASVKGNKLVIVTREYNNHNFEPQANWSDIVNFMQAAFDFSQKKILLKKA